MNLLLNAIEAMGANGVLTVSTEITGDKQLQIQIQDTGVGIAPENLARLFKPFFTTKTNGTGLGLAISRRIVLEHHGAIEVQERNRQRLDVHAVAAGFGRGLKIIPRRGDTARRCRSPACGADAP